MPRCKAKKKDGSPCPVRARPSGFCWVHDPELAGERAGGRRQGGVTRSGGQRSATLPPDTPDLPLKTVADVTAALALTFNQARRGQIGVALANALGQLAGQLVRAIEGSDLEQRIAALEGRREWGRRGA